jgi:hypothetical protein
MKNIYTTSCKFILEIYANCKCKAQNMPSKNCKCKNLNV